MIKSQKDDEVTLRLVTLGSQWHPETKGQREEPVGSPGGTGAPVGLPIGSWTTEMIQGLLTTTGRMGGEKYPGFSLLPLQSPSSVFHRQIQFKKPVDVLASAAHILKLERYRED